MKHGPRQGEVDTAPRHLANARLLWTSPAAAWSAELEQMHAGAHFIDAANEHRSYFPGRDRALFLEVPWTAD